MCKISKIKKVPRLISDRWTSKKPRTVFRLDEFNSTVKYMVIEKQDIFGVSKIYFYTDRKNNCRLLFNIKTDVDPTYNCQLGTLAGIEILLINFTDSKEFELIFKEISKECIGKNLICVDLDFYLIPTLRKTGLVIHDTLDFRSTNDNKRSFVLIRRPI